MHAVSEGEEAGENTRGWKKEERAKRSDCKAGRRWLPGHSIAVSEWYSEVWVSGGESRGHPEESGGL